MVIESVTPIIVAPSSDTWAIVRITTDTGITGWGEFSGYPMSNQAVSAIIRTFAPQLVGKNPRDIDGCLRPITNWRYPSFLDSRFMVLALSAMDMALWDIAAQDEGVPLHQMLGGGASPIPLYANLNRLLRKDRSLEKLLSAADKAIKDGLSMVKVAPFDEVTPYKQNPDTSLGIERYRAVARELGAERVSLDCHCRFTPDSFDELVKQMGQDIEQISFVEDPVRIHWARDIEPVYRRHPNLIYASGEDCYSADELMDLAQSGMFKILNPDVKYIGGISGCRSIILQMLELGVQVCLHNPSGPIATAHSAQLSSICKETMLEFAFGDSATREAFIGEREFIENGFYHLSGKPGIGIAPDSKFLEQYGEVRR